MIKTQVTVNKEAGMDGRPIAQLVQEASRYASRILIECDGKQINAKSIMGMMSLSLEKGEKLVVSAEGADEEKATEGIKTFFMQSV